MLFNNFTISRASKIMKNFKALRILFRLFLHPVRWLTKITPRDKNLWVFGSNGGDTFTGNPKYLFLQLARREDIRCIWITANREIFDELRKLGFEVYKKNSLKAFYYVSRAGILFFDYSTFDINFWASGGGVKVNLWHGLPLKKISHDDKNDLRNTRNPLKRIILRIFRPWTFEKWNFSVATSEAFREKLSSGLGIPQERIPVTGYPRNDIFFKEIEGAFIGSSKEVYDALKIRKSEGAKLFAYFPTFRESGENPLDWLDLARISKIFQKFNSYFIVKLHQYSNFQPKGEFPNVIFIKQSFDFYPLLPLIDVMITDYSSIYLDFLMLDRPIIFYPFDLEKYLSENRELYFEYDNFTPGPKARNFDELLSYLVEYLSGDVDRFMRARKEFIPKVYRYVDGESAGRIYEYFKKV